MKLEQIRNIEVDHLRAHNLMQIELAKRKFGQDMPHNMFSDWAKEYSSKFRLAIDKLINENPTIMDEWENEVNRDAILLRLEEILYKE